MDSSISYLIVKAKKDLAWAEYLKAQAEYDAYTHELREER